MTLYAYIYRDPTNAEPFYVGKGMGDRAYAHLRESQCHNKGVRYRIRKLKEVGLLPIVEVIETSTQEFAFMLERGLIKMFGRKNIKTGTLYNLTDGGEGPFNAKRSEETRRKMSNSKKRIATSIKKGQKLSESHANKLREHLVKARALIDHTKTFLPKATCLVCKKTGTYNGMARFHFDNCKGVA